jgi:hypothetical protein
MVQIKSNLHIWKNIHVQEIGRLNIIKMSIFSKLTYKFNTIPNKISPFCSYCKKLQADLKIQVDIQGTVNNQNNLEKEES